MSGLDAGGVVPKCIKDKTHAYSMSTNCEEERLFRAAINGDLEGVKRLVLDCGADPNVRNNGGWTPLHGAAFRCRIDMARVLLDHGADLTIKG